MGAVRQMLSGPDLGGGFLFQLSHDVEGSRSGFTFHAQEGGLDAQGPPKGSLSPFGFVRTEVPCQFGGRGCWHREFDSPEADTARVRAAYHRMRFVMAPMLEQRYGAAPVPVDEALAELSTRVIEPMAAAGRPIWVGGSASAYLQGAEVHPRDIDLGTDAEGARGIGEGLAEFLIEPVAITRWGPARRLAGRAFVGTMVRGVRVEWAAAETGTTTGGSALEWATPFGELPILRVEHQGRMFPVSRLEFALVRAAEAGDKVRVAAIASKLVPGAADLALLNRLLEGAPDAGRVRALVAASLPGLRA